MFKKIMAFSCLLFGSVLCSSEVVIDLPFYKETEHFQACCLEQDFTAAEVMLQDLEKYWIEWSQDVFGITFSKKVTLNIFPDIQSYHVKVFGNNSCSDWVVCTFNDKHDSISIVSSKNPGPMHTEESIMKCGRLCLGWFFTHQKCGKMEPFWLTMGLSYYKVKIYSKELIYQHLLNKDNEIEIPSLSRLESRNAFADRPILIACYILTEFLVDQWGMDKALAVLNNYSSFETILGISKEEFRIKCAQYFQPKEQ